MAAMLPLSEMTCESVVNPGRIAAVGAADTAAKPSFRPALAALRVALLTIDPAMMSFVVCDRLLDQEFVVPDKKPAR